MPDRDPVLQNIAAALRDGPGLVGIVSGTPGAAARWTRVLDQARAGLGARDTASLVEDLPVNQGLGLLLLWRRIRARLRPGEGALVAFVFGDGSRASPFTEAEGGQKAALLSPVSDGGRRLPLVEVALRGFAPVEAFLRRSGFDGVTVKWGDEIQVPGRVLSGADPALRDADVVRFVSMRPVTQADAADKDWLGVDASGRITAFVPRRPLAELAALADRGAFRRDGDGLVGGVNLGSIAVSRRLLDVLLEAFDRDLDDDTADRASRPDLDPQLFTALCVARIADPRERSEAWRRAADESAAIRRIDAAMPRLVDRLRAAVEAFAARHGREPALVALDLGTPYWGDVGDHARMAAFYTALNALGPDGDVARALAGIHGHRDGHGNLRAGDVRVGPGVRVRGSVLVDVCLEGAGEVVDSVLIGTRAHRIRARGAFDVASVAADLTLSPGAGAYRVIARDPVQAGPGERVTTVFTPGGALLLRIPGDLDLRDRPRTYDVPVAGNPVSLREAHALALAMDPAEIEARRAAAAEAVLRGPP